MAHDDDLSRRDFVALSALTATTLRAGRPAQALEADPASLLIPADKGLGADWLAALTARGAPTAWRGAELDWFGVPCGGIGCGHLYLGGDGRLWHWDIFNRTAGTNDSHYARPAAPSAPLDSGFALAWNGPGTRGARPLSRAGFRDITASGGWPLTTIDYADDDCPLTARLEAGAPFVPGDLAVSSLPATLLTFTLTNASDAPVDVELAGWLENATSLASAGDWDLTRVNRIERAPGLLWLDCAARPSPARADGRPTIVVEDFEGEDWGAWTVEGEAFGPAPSRRAGSDQRLANFLGVGLANSYPDTDAATGRLLSPPITITRRRLNFLIGGGNHPGQTCINLLREGEVVRTATGANTDAMRWESWDVAEYEGEVLRVEIVDQHTGGWGHIDIDHLELADEPRRGREQAQDEPDWGTMGLALFAPTNADRGWAQLPDEALPAGLFGTVEPTAEGARPVSEGSLRGALSRRLRLAPRASAQVVFAICWHFANHYLDGQLRGREYATRFADARAVADYLAPRQAQLRATGDLWRRTWADSTLPHWLLERALVGANCLATGTTQRWSTGRTWGWEGVGCCAGTCTHVWHYAQAAAWLQPELERGIREQQDFAGGFSPDGQIGMRGEWNKRAAVDGQAGTILRVWREHLLSADDSFLRRLWPRLKQALAWLEEQDEDGDGYIEKGQHNTLDVDWYGPSSWFNTMYLAALRAGAAMARHLGEPELAERWDSLVTRGAERLEADLFNGEFYYHRRDPNFPQAVGSGLGCHIDQILGMLWVRLLGLPGFLDEERERTALASLYRYNFTPDVGPYRNAREAYGGRWYAMPGEAGLLMTTFPHGGAEAAQGIPPVWSAMYFNECMNGFEYQAAVHMIQAGLVTEGLTVARAVHDRYSGAAERRNPHNEVECGDHYARSMASFGLVLALSGYHCDGPAGHLAFAPKLRPDDFRAPWLGAEGWGTFHQARGPAHHSATLHVAHGRLRLASLALETLAPPTTATLRHAGRPVPCRLETAGPTATVHLAAPITIGADEIVEVVLA